MKTKNTIEEQIENTINVPARFKEVKTPPFFKERTLNVIFAQQQETQQTNYFLWFTPSLQLAVLVLFITLNVFTYVNINKSNYNINVEQFAETYGIITNTSSTIFN